MDPTLAPCIRTLFFLGAMKTPAMVPTTLVMPTKATCNCPAGAFHVEYKYDT